VITIHQHHRQMEDMRSQDPALHYSALCGKNSTDARLYSVN